MTSGRTAFATLNTTLKRLPAHQGEVAAGAQAPGHRPAHQRQRRRSPLLREVVQEQRRHPQRAGKTLSRRLRELEADLPQARHLLLGLSRRPLGAHGGVGPLPNTVRGRAAAASPVPRAIETLPALSLSLWLYGVPTGIRTPVAAVKGRCPRPLDDGDLKQVPDEKSAGRDSDRPVLCLPEVFGGARRDRTADLNTASVALSQLSYGPRKRRSIISTCSGVHPSW